MEEDLLVNQASNGNEERKDGQPSVPEKGGSSTLEMDAVNKHECMKNIKRCLDKMLELFSPAWNEAGKGELPEFMQHLLADVQAPETH